MEQRLKLNLQIYEEACEWFIECRAGDLDEATRCALDSWLRKSPEHLSAYLELAAIWNEGPLLDPEGKFDRETLITQAALDRDNVIELSNSRGTESSRYDIAARAEPTVSVSTAESVVRGQNPVHDQRRRLRRRRFAAIAASTIFAVTAAILYLQTPRAPTYATAIGEQRSLALTDGSSVQLNSRSKIVVRYSKQERRVELLQGQALFHVAKDAARPFIVKTGATLVRAVGTEFDVYQKRDGTVVTVVEGRVAILTDHFVALPDPGVSATAINAPHQSNLEFPTIGPGQVGNIMVAAGEQLTVTPKVIQIAQHPNIASATAWTQRQLVFESASLADVADEFNRYNDRQLVVGDPRLETFHVSGVFSSTDPASLIRFLRARPELRIVETEFQIRIEKNTT
jgi:transmembrane sensor